MRIVFLRNRWTARGISMWPRLRAALISSLALIAVPVFAQDPEPLTGLVQEPAILTKLARSADTLTSSEPHDEFYVDTDNMITGEGWISAGPGYRRNVLKGQGRIDVSTVISWNLYQSAQASFEFPHLLDERLSLGTQARYQDVLQVRYFGLGNGSSKPDESAYRFTNGDFIVFGRLKLNRWLSIDGRAGWIPRINLSDASGPMVSAPNTLDRFTEETAPGLEHRPSFIHGDASLVLDSRNHAGHPTEGGLYRVTAAIYSDRRGGEYSFRRYEVEATHFVPLGTRRWVLGLHGWTVFSDVAAGATVPFYLMPSLGGKNTLRGYDSYRFHDNTSGVVNIESRWALFTHMDFATFVDAGTVAHQASALDFGHPRTDYGAGIRFHNATSMWLRIDAAYGPEGWRLFIVLSDPFKRLTPTTGRSSVVPFVP